MRLTSSIYGALCAPFIADLPYSWDAFSASSTVSHSDDQALWENATIVAASLFGQSVSGWTRSSPKFRIFLCPRDTQLITGPRRTSTEPYGQYELFAPLSHRSQLGIRCNTESFAIWKPRPSRIAAWFVAAGVLTAEMVK
jgi:hypothetical protein